VVDYQVEDLFGLPTAWAGAFDLVVEIKTLQSLPPMSRNAATAALVATLHPGGWLFVHCLAGGDDDEPIGTRPWPVSEAELGAFVDAGLVEVEMRDDLPGTRGERCYRAIYERPASWGQS
jgi:hypothetical protein